LCDISVWYLSSESRANHSDGRVAFVSARHHLVVVSTGDNEDVRDTAAVDFLFSNFYSR
jgi:hypothetical protein